MQICSIKIQNFRSLEEVELNDLSGINILVGRNNAGKSSVFDTISYVAFHVFGRGTPTAPEAAVLTDHDNTRKAYYLFNALP